MATCAGNQFRICFTADGSLFVPISAFFNGTNGNETITSAGTGNSNNGGNPNPGNVTAGNSYQMFAGNITVQPGGLQFNFDAGIPSGSLNNHNMQVCIDDNGTPLCCFFNITFDDNPNCTGIGGGGVGGACLGQPVNPGVLTASMFQTGGSFTNVLADLVQAQQGITVSSTDPLTISCDGTTNGSITVRMSDGSDCTAVVNCSGNTGGGNCLNNPVNPGVLLASMFRSDGMAFTSVLADIVQGQQGITVSSTNPLTITCDGTTDGSITVRMADGIDCTAVVNCSGNTGGGGDECIDTTASTIGIVESGPFGPGDTITFQTNMIQQNGTVGITNHFILIKDPAGNFSDTSPSFVSIENNNALWSWTIPSNCTNGNYSVCVFPPAGSNCPFWDAGTFPVAGCDDTPVGQCKTAQISIVEGTSTTVTPGQVMAGATAFGSTNPATSSNNAVASVSGQSATGFSVNAGVPGVATISVDMGNNVVCTCQINVTAAGAGGCSTVLTDQLQASPANPSAGQTVTITAPAGQCSCTGCTVVITELTNFGVVLSNGGVTTAGGQVSYTHPAVAPGVVVRFASQCCCPGSG